MWLARDQPGRAVSDITAAIRQNPNSAALYFARALVKEEAQLWNGAIDDCMTAVRLKKDYAGPYAIRAKAEFRLGARDAAFALAGLALELDSKMGLPYYIRGHVFHDRQEYAQAIKEFDRTIAIEPSYVSAIVMRAIAEAHAGSFESARHDLDEAVLVFPGTAESHIMQAWFLATCPNPAFRDGSRAIAEAEVAVKITHEAPHALDILATAYAETGDFTKAAELEKIALDKTPAGSTDCYPWEARLLEFSQGTAHRDAGGTVW